MWNHAMGEHSLMYIIVNCMGRVFDAVEGPLPSWCINDDQVSVNLTTLHYV